MLVFAYDGSLNGDWIAHYAVRFALASATPQLRLRMCMNAHRRRNSRAASRALPTNVARSV
jgi:hypothetical protein